MTPRVLEYAAIEGEKVGLTADEVLRAGAARAPSRARWAVMRRLRDDGFTHRQIGHWLGLDHTTVSYGLREIERLAA